MLSVGERASIQRAGQDSHFVDALAAHPAGPAAAEGTRLASAGAAPVVEPDSLAALTKIAEEAPGAAEGSELTIATVKSRACSCHRGQRLAQPRLLNLKETADRLRG